MQRAIYLTALGRFSSLYIGILAATKIDVIRPGQNSRFSSLYIGILAATTS